MKNGLRVSIFLVLTFIVFSYVFAQQASPVPSVSTVSSPVPVSAPGVYDFIKTHVSAIALVIYAALDLLILAVPSLAGNGLAHQLLLWTAKLSGQTPPTS